MEKDYFKDRLNNDKLDEAVIGRFVYICTKENQKIACELKHLNYGKIVQLYTKHNHPRGIKCLIEAVDTRFMMCRSCFYQDKKECLKSKNKYYRNCFQKQLIKGRIVYLTIDGKILTKNGLLDKKNIK